MHWAGQIVATLPDLVKKGGFHEKGGVPKIRGTILGVTIIRIIVYWSHPYFGKLPIIPADWLSFQVLHVT